PHEETALRLVVPIGLLHCATRLAHRIDRPTGRVRSLLAGLRIGLLIDLFGLEVQNLVVADVLQHKRLGAVTHDNPVTLIDFQLGHRKLSGPPADYVSFACQDVAWRYPKVSKSDSAIAAITPSSVSVTVDNGTVSTLPMHGQAISRPLRSPRVTPIAPKVKMMMVAT